MRFQTKKRDSRILDWVRTPRAEGRSVPSSIICDRPLSPHNLGNFSRLTARASLDMYMCNQ
jgi:hypothetical protein